VYIDIQYQYIKDPNLIGSAPLTTMNTQYSMFIRLVSLNLYGANVQSASSTDLASIINDWLSTNTEQNR
jgi:hypothetical protein